METSRSNCEPSHTGQHRVSDNLPTFRFVMMISEIAFASVGFLSVPALARENGTTDSPQARSIAKMAPAGPITVGGP
jgi:hypothetical protein